MAQRTAKAKRSAGKQKPASRKKAAPRKTVRKKSMHDHLPFFHKDEKTGDVSWWRVNPTGDWCRDLETGKQYARALLPSLHYNGGPPLFGWIFDGIVQAAKRQKPPQPVRVIDNIASGFLMELVNIFQQAHVAVAIAESAMSKPDGSLAAHFKAASADGTLLHEPKFKMLEIHKPAKGSDCWHGMAVGGMEQYEWFYWLDGETLRVNKFVVQPDQPICEGRWMERAPIPDELRRDVMLAVLLTQEGLA